ncbi:MAG: RNA polymerase factor sigma-54 [Planctomycetaceae bacterium]|nr:RNA polymerase factor sigma-54 [Planctomycetaceae bacterium]
MHLNISQQMKMSQQMKLAPRMIQSMEILQLNMMALNERIEQELVENVTLEVVNKDRDLPSAEPDTVTQVDDPREARELRKDVESRELVAGNEKNNESDFERLVEIAAEWPEDNVGFGGSRPSSNQVSDDMDRHSDAMANMVARPQSLHEYLLEQFSFHSCDDAHRQFGEYLIQHLDHNGRLQSTLAEINQQFNRTYGQGLTIEDAEGVLKIIQRLDPPGVGARDHREMLLLQVDDHLAFHDVVEVLIRDHLEDIAFNRLPLIQKATGYSIDLIKVGIEQIQTLNPYPGRGFEQRPVQRVTPDLAVERDDTGRYVVRLLDEYVPELRISPRYQRMLKDNPSQETRDWIRRKVESARWLIESIEQRYNTLRKVAQEIVDHQQEFLDKGPEFIAPLKMQQIADRVGVHVTTVSRAVDEKWIQTPRGLFPLKRFFGGGTQTAEGEDVAWDTIRIKLQELIDNEDKSNPLSDDALVDELGKQGITLARRTITKYRKQMMIPSSRQRREY